ncbi:Serpin_1 [Hexamita inflata]|uniref:Serpin 1 n=1 Tax=Hexamita inflata TaxID=28002 RepID=A0AA86UQM3_9EUKA|nr:Serpin 1 [Hexamita inflata]
MSESQIFELKQSLSSTLSIASNIFCTNAQQLTSFESTIFKCFNLAPEPLVSVDQVNQWCTRNTNGKITEIIDSIIGIECILLSAVHFKANWAFKFDKRSTKNAAFTGFASNSSVQMMRMSRKLQYAQTASAQIVRLDYTAQLSALIILPLQNNIKAFQAALTFENISTSLTEAQVVLELPKFKVSSKLNLLKHLQQLNISKIFSINGLKINEITQKTIVEVNEEGTEAASVTKMATKCARRPEELKVLKCDKPFWFVICGRENDVVFVTSIVE